MTLTATLPVGLGNFSVVSGINDQDELVGVSVVSLPIAWQNGLYIRPVLYGSDTSGHVNGINELGQIVGDTDTLLANHPVLWQSGIAKLVVTPGGSGRLFGINDSGTMVGSARDSRNYDNAYVVHGGVATDLGALPGGDATASGSVLNSRALAINDAEQIVGFSMTSFGVNHATLWQNGVITDLGGIANNKVSEALAINQGGLTAGYAYDATGLERAVTWLNGALTVLPGLSSSGASVAYAVNDSGLIVGAANVYTSGGWKTHAVVWQNGVAIDLNTLMPSNNDWVLNSATVINNNGEIGGSATLDGLITSAYTLSIGDAAGPAVSASGALQAFSEAPHSQAWNVSDSAANILADLDGLANMALTTKLLQITFTDAKPPLLTLTDAQWSADYLALGVMAGGYSIHITGTSVADAQARLNSPHVTAVGIADTANNIYTNLAEIENWASRGELSSVTLTDANPTLNLYGTDLAGAQSVLSLIKSPYQLGVISASAAEAVELAANPHLAGMIVDDTAANIVEAWSTLAKLTVPIAYDVADTAANVGPYLDALKGISDTGATLVLWINGTLSVGAAQLSKDFSILRYATGVFAVSIDASQPLPTTLDGGVPGHTTIVKFSGNEAQYALSAATDGGITVSGSAEGKVTIHGLSDALQVQFSDNTITVAGKQSFGEYTALLYQGALGRTPDPIGLESWNKLANGLPASEQATGVYALSNYSGNFNGTLSLAGGFTNSAEFQAKYGSLSDAQFVTQLYTNVLDRAPDPGGYATWVKALTPVSQGGLGESRDYVLVGFAESVEAISNATQGFAGHSGTHAAWLFLT